ncbi:Pirin-like protein [Apostasia shenzhenica]|uniref:Pirin-like protein n=1 Tax=Apostasia shenzhenica TaxID=1088818 RepID=A0A2I0A4M1_9ASPA|nr:Pirin-like protein [Apostasia shenzhenica]
MRIACARAQRDDSSSWNFNFMASHALVSKQKLCTQLPLLTPKALSLNGTKNPGKRPKQDAYKNPLLISYLSQLQNIANPQHLLGKEEETMAETKELLCSLRKPRSVVKKFQAKPQNEGDGAVVRRSIGRYELNYFDPFLLLDEFSVAAPAGFPDHPHRGFETVTYMLEGAVRHEDFEGHKGTIKAGDLQWMTAGRGIVHSEMPAAPGTSKGLQLWVNLSSSDKMIEPKYQELKSGEVAAASRDGVEVRVIAGESMGVRSPVQTRTPTMYLDFTLKPSAHLRQPIPPGWSSFVYVLQGEGIFGTEKSGPVGPHHLLLLGRGDGLDVWNKSMKSLRFVLLAGLPLGEPVARYGPFVMNSDDEIDRTIEDFDRCINGFEKAKHWRSSDLIGLEF